MSTEIDILIEKLQSNDSDVQLLALDTLSRFKFQNNVNSESITNLQEVLIGFGRVEDHELQNLIDAVVQNIKHHIYEADSSQNEFGSNLDSDKKLKYDLQNLHHADSKIRKQCLIQIINHKLVEAYDSVLDMLIIEEEVTVLALAIKTLSLISSPKICKLLEVFNYHPDPSVRQNSMLAISDLGNISDTVDLIVPAINISSPNEVIYASDILSKYKPEDVFLHIKKTVQDPLEHRRVRTLNSLSKLEGDEAVKLINIFTNDKSSRIRALAVEALKGRTQTTLIIPILKRLAQDPDIEVSEMALKYLNSYSDQPLVQRIELSEPSESLASQPAEMIEKTITETPLTEDTRNITIKEDTNIDDQIEIQFLSLGKQCYRKINSGDVNHEGLFENANIIKKFIGKVEELERTREKNNLVKSIKQVIGGNLDHKLTLQKAKIDLEEAYIDLGETGFNLICSNKISIQGAEQYVSKLNQLFKLRKELLTKNG